MEDYIKKTKDFYDKNIEKYIGYTKDKMVKEWMDKFISKLGKGAKVLDIGCAYGRDCKYLVEKGLKHME